MMRVAGAGRVKVEDPYRNGCCLGFGSWQSNNDSEQSLFGDQLHKCYGALFVLRFEDLARSVAECERVLLDGQEERIVIWCNDCSIDQPLRPERIRHYYHGWCSAGETRSSWTISKLTSLELLGREQTPNSHAALHQGKVTIWTHYQLAPMLPDYSRQTARSNLHKLVG